MKPSKTLLFRTRQHPVGWLCLLVSSASVSLAAVDFTTVAAGGDWGSAANWTPAGGPPASGHAVAVNHATTVSDNRSYGDPTGAKESTGNSTITIGSGATLTHVAGSTHRRNGTSVNGPGMFLNQGHYLDTYRFYLKAGCAFDCPGTLELTSQFSAYEKGTVLRLANGRLLKTTSSTHSMQSSASGTGANGIITSVDANGDLQPVEVDVQAGTLSIENSGTGQIQFGPLRVASGATLNLKNSNITYSSTDGDMFNVDGKVVLAANFRIAENVTLNAAQGVEWTGGAIYLNGFTVTNPALNTLTRGGGAIYGNGTSGTFVNAGTLNVTTRFFTYDGATFVNLGTFQFVSGDYASIGTGTTFDNRGTLRSCVSYKIQSGTLLNSGTVAVTNGTLELDSTLAVGSFYSSVSRTMTTGTWNILAAPAGTASLNLAGANSNKVKTIGPNASVTLSGAGASFPNLVLTNVVGTLGIAGHRVFSVGTDLTLPGRLAVTLDDTDVGASVQNGLSVTGNLDLTGGALDVLDGGLVEGGTYAVASWTGTRTGTLSLGTLPNEDWRGSLTYDDNAKVVLLNLHPAGPAMTMIVIR